MLKPYIDTVTQAESYEEHRSFESVGIETTPFADCCHTPPPSDPLNIQPQESSSDYSLRTADLKGTKPLRHIKWPRPTLQQFRWKLKLELLPRAAYVTSARRAGEISIGVGRLRLPHLLVWRETLMAHTQRGIDRVGNGGSWSCLRVSKLLLALRRHVLVNTSDLCPECLGGANGPCNANFEACQEVGHC
jgi:hypothetical protein